MGVKSWSSSFGDTDDRLPDGMGPASRKVVTFDDEAVIFVELAYDYQPLISVRFVDTPFIKTVASFTVRSNRDLSGIFQRDVSNPDPVADCNTFSNPFAPFGGGGSGDGGGSSSSTSTTSGGNTSTTSGGTTSTTSGGSSGSCSWGGSSGGSSGSSSWGGSSGSSSRGGSSGRGGGWR